MPSTTPERQARWPGMDAEAMNFLESRGYKLNRDWCWSPPEPDHDPTVREVDALIYLIEEWDYGGLESEKRGVG